MTFVRIMFHIIIKKSLRELLSICLKATYNMFQFVTTRVDDRVIRIIANFSLFHQKEKVIYKCIKLESPRTEFGGTPPNDSCKELNDSLYYIIKIIHCGNFAKLRTEVKFSAIHLRT